jgi:hypothetical protein
VFGVGVSVLMSMSTYADRECIAAGEDVSSSGVILAEALRMTSSSAGAKSSGGIPPIAT